MSVVHRMSKSRLLDQNRFDKVVDKVNWLVTSHTESKVQSYLFKLTPVCDKSGDCCKFEEEFPHPPAFLNSMHMAYPTCHFYANFGLTSFRPVFERANESFSV